MARRGSDPPLLGRLMLRLRRLGERREEIETDLRELFRERAAERGRWYATFRHCADAASLWIHRTEPRPVAAARRGRGLDGLLLDARFAVRMFRRQIGVVSVTVAGLALAIGVCTVVYGFVVVIFMPSFGAPDPSSIVEVTRVYSRGTRPSSHSYAEYLQLREGAELVALEAYYRERAPLGDTDVETVRVTLVSGGFFETLGVHAAVGRVLTGADDSRASTPAVVVNHAFWQKRLNGDESIVGQTVRLMGTPFTVVGVVEDGFVGPTGGAEPPEFWAPLSTHRRVWELEATRIVYVYVVGRLAEGATRQQAEAEVAALVAGIASERAGGAGEQAASVGLDTPNRRFGDPGFRGFFAIIITILGLVLLLACTNMANLLLAGAIARRREVALRLALGASRWRVVRQLVTESLMLSALAGGLGLLLTFWFMPILASLVDLPATVDVKPDFRVFGFLAVITLLVGLGAGVAPARYGALGELAAPLKGDAAANRSGRPGRTRSMLVGAQAVASIVLLVFAALFTRAMVRVTQFDVGFDADRVIAVTPSFRAAGYDAARAADYWDHVLERVAGLPGVERAALARYTPLGDVYGRREVFQYNGREHAVYFNETSADYFATMGIPVIRGRTFTEEEVAIGAPVAVISESLAHGLWEDGDPLGATLDRLDQDLSGVRVVGIVAEAGGPRLDPDAALLYQPLAPANAQWGRLVVRTSGDAATALQPTLEAIRALDPEVLPMAATVRDGLDRALQAPRLFATVAGILGAIALGLAVTGVFGLTAFSVEQRTGEIGVRLAVGADAADVVRLMLRDSLRPVVAGLAVGLLVAVGASRVLTAVLYGVSARDPLSILGAVVILLGAAALAAAVPARRATRVDPAAVLRRS